MGRGCAARDFHEHWLVPPRLSLVKFKPANKQFFPLCTTKLRQFFDTLVALRPCCWHTQHESTRDAWCWHPRFVACLRPSLRAAQPSHAPLQSPRRSDILRQLGIEFSVVPSAFKEDLDKSTFASPVRCSLRVAVAPAQRSACNAALQARADVHKHGQAAYVEETARQKALDVFHRVACDGAGAPLVIAADTVVVSPDGTILEKPAVPAAAALPRPLPA